MGKYLNAVNSLIIINVLIYFASQSAGGQLLDSLALYFPKNDQFGIWQLFTHMFMHGGITHLLFNMFGLWMFGTPLEQMWGKSRFLIFFFLSGIGAAVIYTTINYFQFNTLFDELVNIGLSPAELQNALSKSMYFPAVEKSKELLLTFQTPMVGASGAIYGILVAFGINFPNTKMMLIFLPFPIAAKYFIPAIIALDLFSGVTGFSIFGGGVAHFAHVGGAVIGFLLVMYWRKTLVR